MPKSKLEKPVSLRLPARMKALILEEADKEMRGFNETSIILFAEALHGRRCKSKFNLNDYT